MKPSFDLAQEMHSQLKPKFASRKDKLSLAVEHLCSAVEYFEKAGNFKSADAVTDLVEKIAYKAGA